MCTYDSNVPMWLIKSNKELSVQECDATKAKWVFFSSVHKNFFTFHIDYSVLKLFTGFANAALIE